MTKQGDADGDTLQSFVERLNKSHYDMINAMCNTAKHQIQTLQAQEAQQIPSQYVTFSDKLVGEVLNYISVKKEHLIPYVQSLFEKESDGHDCSNCTGTGSCSMQHETRLMEIRQSHRHLTDIISRMQMVMLPLYSGTVHLGLYKTLQNQMALLENSLAALLLFEETHLIPKITEAQTNINARGRGI